jgi:hypothetical protein
MLSTNRADELRMKWQGAANNFRTYGAAEYAAMMDQVLADFEHALRDDGEVFLNLTQAARVTGYTPNHLGRLIADKQLKNYGRAGAPRVRLAELPKKRVSIASQSTAPYDAGTDARLLLRRRGE